MAVLDSSYCLLTGLCPFQPYIGLYFPHRHLDLGIALRSISPYDTVRL